MICAGLLTNFSELFGGMSIVTFMLIASGLILIVVEFFQPSYGIAAGCGALITLTGITVRMLSGGTLIMLFFMVFFCAVVLCAAYTLMLVTQKRAWLSTSLALKLKRSVLEEESESYDSLLGRKGIATTDIAESGHIAVDDVNLFVTCDDFIPKGCAVRVVRVNGDRISVERADGEEEESNA
ncbi:MAG: hypothetical protein K2L51_01715 [Clostridiales bacterium]|nr:hypothetical protein [Clostridiales bacterium]